MIIETDVDRFVELIDAKGEVSIKECSRLMNVEEHVLENWAEILHKSDIIEVIYCFRNIFFKSIEREVRHPKIVKAAIEPPEKVIVSKPVKITNKKIVLKNDEIEKVAEKKKVKPVVKKPVKKFRVSIKTVNEVFKDAPEDKKFWLCDGSAIRNFEELEYALRYMSEEIYGHHVNENRNDFYDWILNVFKDTTIADEIKKSRNRTKAADALRKFLENRIAC